MNFFFSNLTGERIAFDGHESMIYASPVVDVLGVTPRGQIGWSQLSSPTFFGVLDVNGDWLDGLAFTDRNGAGNGLQGRTGALAHARIASHTTRGRGTDDAEGVRGCTACHNILGGGQVGLTGDWNGDGVKNQAEYMIFRDAIANRDYASLDYPLLQEILGRNTHNTLGHPIKVAVTMGLGSGLFLFDDQGCPVNPLDGVSRGGYPCPPASQGWPARLSTVAYSFDRVVEENGRTNASLSQPVFDRIERAAELRDGALRPGLAGPLGQTLIQRLSDPIEGIVLDSWIDSDGNAGGQVLGVQPDLSIP